jgi:formylmethanofuran dehydrogenase subunit B
VVDSAPPTSETTPAHFTCAGCALHCDDVTVERAGDDVRLRPRCELGAQWFSARAGRSASGPAATVGGQPTDVESALSRAAELLRAARRPLLHGFDAATVQDARAAVALADRLGALVATDSVTGAWPGAPAIPLRGASTATLGEIRDRSQLVVIWREDPETTHPRLLDRLGFGGGASSAALPPTRRPGSSEWAGATSSGWLGAERTLMVIDDRDTATARRADLRLRWPREHDLEALTGLHALQRRLALRGTELELELEGLLEQVNAVPHATFVHGPGLTAGVGGQRRALALHELVRALCHDRHVVTLALPDAAGNRSAQDVLTWQSGYAGNVDFANGHPELVTTTRPLAAAEGVDVSLRIEGAPDDELAGVAEIVLSSLPAPEAEVSIRTAAAGVHAVGTAHRLDGVPVALQAPFPNEAPTAAALLTRLLEELER